MHKISKLTREIEKAREQLKINVGNKLTNIRTNNGLTQEELAEKVGITRTTITNIEKGTQNITAFHLILLCDFLNVSADYLLGLKDE